MKEHKLLEFCNCLSCIVANFNEKDWKIIPFAEVVAFCVSVLKHSFAQTGAGNVMLAHPDFLMLEDSS